MALSAKLRAICTGSIWRSAFSGWMRRVVQEAGGVEHQREPGPDARGGGGDAGLVEQVERRVAAAAEAPHRPLRRQRIRQGRADAAPGANDQNGHNRLFFLTNRADARSLVTITGPPAPAPRGRPRQAARRFREGDKGIKS